MEEVPHSCAVLGEPRGETLRGMRPCLRSLCMRWVSPRGTGLSAQAYKHVHFYTMRVPRRSQCRPRTTSVAGFSPISGKRSELLTSHRTPNSMARLPEWKGWGCPNKPISPGYVCQNPKARCPTHPGAPSYTGPRVGRSRCKRTQQEQIVKGYFRSMDAPHPNSLRRSRSGGAATFVCLGNTLATSIWVRVLTKKESVPFSL